MYGAYVNTDGFTLGEKAELFYGIRAYEIARHEQVSHYVWANTDYAVKKAGWDERYHWGHNDAKGRVGGKYLRFESQLFLKLARLDSLTWSKWNEDFTSYHRSIYGDVV